MAYTPIARPCRAASGCGWYTLPGWRSRSRRWRPWPALASAPPHHGVAKWSGVDAVRQPAPQDRRGAPEGADLRRRWGCLSRGDRGRIGRRRWGIATGRVRTDCRGSGGVSGGALTNHPFGTPAHNPRADDPRGTIDPPTSGDASADKRDHISSDVSWSVSARLTALNNRGATATGRERHASRPDARVEEQPARWGFHLTTAISTSCCCSMWR
jgi:hypothetical protein